MFSPGINKIIKEWFSYPIKEQLGILGGCLLIIIAWPTFYLWWPFVKKKIKWNKTDCEVFSMIFADYIRTWFNAEKFIWSESTLENLERYCYHNEDVWKVDYLTWKLQQ